MNLTRVTSCQIKLGASNISPSRIILSTTTRRSRTGSTTCVRRTHGCIPPSRPGSPPLINYLGAVAAGGDIAFPAILVSRERDPALRRLEDRAVAVAAQSISALRIHGGGASAELAQKIASLVVDVMGGPVEDADCINTGSLFSYTVLFFGLGCRATGPCFLRLVSVHHI
jgi:hypothetical protein